MAERAVRPRVNYSVAACGSVIDSRKTNGLRLRLQVLAIGRCAPHTVQSILLNLTAGLADGSVLDFRHGRVCRGNADLEQIVRAP